MEKDHEALSVRRQCELLALNGSSLYYEQKGLSEDDLEILDEMDRIYLAFPYYGSRTPLCVKMNETLLGIEISEEGRRETRDVESREVERSGGEWEWCLGGWVWRSAARAGGFGASCA